MDKLDLPWARLKVTGGGKSDVALENSTAKVMETSKFEKSNAFNPNRVRVRITGKTLDVLQFDPSWTKTSLVNFYLDF